MIEIIGWMLAAYMIPRLLESATGENVKDYIRILSFLGGVGVAVCVFLLHSQSQTINQINPFGR